MRVMDVNMYGVDLESVIFWIAFARDAHRPHLTLHGVEDHQLQHAVTFGVSAG